MKKNLLSIVILALLLVNIGLTAVMMISVTSTNNKTAALVTTIATVMNLELSDGTAADSGSTSISITDTEVYEVSSMTIPLQNEVEGQKQVYMVCGISLMINTKHDDYETLNASVATNESIIKDAIRSVVSSKTETECRSNQEELKAEILQAIQELFGSDFIYGIAISDAKFGS